LRCSFTDFGRLLAIFAGSALMGFDIFLDDIEPLHIERLPAQTVLKRLWNQLIQYTRSTVWLLVCSRET